MTRVKKIRGAIPCALLLGALFLSGCSQDDPADMDGDRTAAVFNAGIQTTRTTGGGDAWTTADKVGIFMLTPGGTLPGGIVGTGANAADNREYNVANTSGALSPVGTPIYYPQSGNVDFIAYYPYGTTGTGAGQINDYTYNITVAGQTSADAQNELDVLYAKKTDVAKTKTAVDLVFDHVLSKVTLNVKAGNGLTVADIQNLAAGDVVFGGMPVTAELALQNGTLTPGTDLTQTFNPMKAATPTATYAATFTALVVPQAANAYTGRTMVFTVDGEDYTWAIPADETFAAGNHYTYPVTVKLSGVTVGTPDITDWDTNDNGTGTTTEIGAGIEKVHIPAGTFKMGSESAAAEPNSYNNERPQREMNIGEFWLGKYEITNTQYAAFLNDAGIGSNGQGSVTYDNNGISATENQRFISAHSWGVTHDGSVWKAQAGYEKHPVINVTWYGATAFAASVGGRLPTEAEWEYACRAGTTTPFGIGDGTKLTGDMANINGRYIYELPAGHQDLGNGNGTYLGHTTAVGSYAYPNAWGLYDMHGNVMEWTSGYWTNSYSEAEMQSPNTSSRVLRGGYWGINAQNCRSAFRLSNSPDSASNDVGFRVAFVP